MKRKILLPLLVLLLLALFPIAVSADTGPKPSVKLNISGLDGRQCFATLLSQTESTGPHSSVELARKYGYIDDVRRGENLEIFDKFAEYRDGDGFYFLCTYDDVSSGQYTWGYYPPQVFKILLYFPESDSFLVSDVYERYAFVSTFDITVGDALDVAKTPISRKNIPSFLARVLLTVTVEFLVALLFGYRGKRAFVSIVAVNLITQTALNLLLTHLLYVGGTFRFFFGYFAWEIPIFLAEWIAYAILLPKVKNHRRALPYALVANVASFAVGVYLWNVMPAIF